MTLARLHVLFPRTYKYVLARTVQHEYKNVYCAFGLNLLYRM